MSHLNSYARSALTVSVFCLYLIVLNAPIPGYREVKAQTLSQTVGTLLSVADMLVVPDKSGVTVYVSDPSSGGVFYFRRANEEPGPIGFSDFKLLVKTTRPSGLAYREGKLLVADPGAHAIFEVDLNSGADLVAKPLQINGLLRRPEHVAVSDTGILFVGSDTEVQYFVPEAKGPRFVYYDRAAYQQSQTVADIDRITFDGRSLVVLDEQGRGNLYTINLDTQVKPMPTLDSEAYTPLLRNEVRTKLPSIQDFAAYRGVYYVAGHEQVFVFGRSRLAESSGREVLTMLVPKDSVKDISKIALSEKSIYILDADKKMILDVARPVPIVIDFPKVDAAAIEEQIQIFEDLDNTGTLVAGTILSSKLYDDLNRFVLNDLFSGLQDASLKVKSPEVPISALTRMSQLICRLNEWTCEVQEKKDGVQVIKKTGKIGLRNEVIVPSFAIKGYALDKFAKPTSELTDLKTYLFDRRLIPLSVHSDKLSPGQIVKVESRENARPEVIGQCSGEVSNLVAISPTLFPNEVSMEPEDFTRQIGAALAGSALEKLGVERVAVKYADVQYQRLKLNLDDKRKACDGLALDPASYVVDRILVASSAYYRFLNDKGKIVSVPARLSMSFGLGETDPTKEWSWIVSTRLNLGFTASQFRLGKSEQVTDVSYLRPVLPPATKEYAQQLTLLVKAQQAPALIQSLNPAPNDPNAKAQRRTLLYATSVQDQAWAVKEKSTAIGGDLIMSSAPVPNQTLTVALKERKELMEAIHFPPHLSDLDAGGIRVGIVEKPDSIERFHQCFWDQDGSQMSWDDDLSLFPQIPSEPGAVKTAQEFNLPNNPEHGTHVAALIGAKRFLRGLVPTARLVTINPAKLERDMDENVKDVGIYNFSVDLPGPAEQHNKLHARIRGRGFGDDLVFVVAAGNQNKNLEDITLPAPLSWVSTLPNNVIVVGASTSGKRPTRLTVVKKGNEIFPEEASNYSKKYVHLFAPGDQVYSAAKDNKYAPGSGTSQAAPQVTAVAALLRLKRLSPAWIKAVLIYTADWRKDLMEEVWGGILNAERAMLSADGKPGIWFHDSTEAQVFTPFNKGMFKIVIKEGARINDPNQKEDQLAPLNQDEKVNFEDILRVQRMPDGGDQKGKFRIIYLDNAGVMKMVIEAQIEGGIRCAVKFDKGVRVEEDLCSKFAENGKKDGEISFDKVIDYIGKVPNKTIRFPQIIQE